MLINWYFIVLIPRSIPGLLERPVLQNVEEVSYKLFFVGKNGSGKSSTIARLAGIVDHDGGGEYVETRGIRKTNIYWPVKVWDRIILFRLQCWDAGDRDVKKFGHISPVGIRRLYCMLGTYCYDKTYTLVLA